MTRNDMIGLFQNHLRRMPQEAEINFHIHKEKKQFENELLTCQEKKSLLASQINQITRDLMHLYNIGDGDQNSHVIDCGAWDGYETLDLLSRFPNSIIVVIEPVREMYEKHLLPRFKDNPRVKVLPMAVDATTGFRKFNVSNKNHFVSSFFEFRTSEAEDWDVPLVFDQSYMVPTITLRDVCLLFNIKKIEHIHMDTQGNDLVALKSLREKIEIVKTGICEASFRLNLYEGTNNEHKDVELWLKDCGFMVDVKPHHMNKDNECDIHFWKEV